MEAVKQKSAATIDRSAPPTLHVQRSAAAAARVQPPSVRVAPRVQPSSLRVSSPSDPAEKEAESTARQVVRMSIPDRAIAFVRTAAGGVFRAIRGREKEKEELERLKPGPGKLMAPQLSRSAGTELFRKTLLDEERERQEKERLKQQPPQIARFAAGTDLSRKTLLDEERERERKEKLRQQPPQIARFAAGTDLFRKTLLDEERERERKERLKQQPPQVARFAAGADLFRKTLLDEERERERKEKLRQQPPQVARFAAGGVLRAPGDIQRKAEGLPNVGSNVAAEIQASSAAGNPLPLSVRRFMEPRFKADFSQVKVHTDDRAAKLSRQVNAKAFAVGNNVFFGKGQFQPETGEGRELIAHELTHTIQQGAALQRSEDVTVTQQSPVQVQRLGISDALDYFADKANLIPGFRMLTIVLGVNPVNMRRVERSAANIMRAVVEFIPGGGLITRALDNYGVFDKVGGWVEQQIKSLGMTGSAFKAAIDEFLDSLSWTDIFDLGGVWRRAKRIFTEPVDQLITFAGNLVDGILGFIREAILRPLAGLAEGTRGYDLLKAILGKDPITGDPVPRNAETLIGGFMKLIGQEEVWENIKKGNAIGRAWAWFQESLSGLMAQVRAIPGRFMDAVTSLTLADIVVLPRAFAKVAGVFLDVIGGFFSWAAGQVMKLLEIVFDVVSPGAMGYVRRTGAALLSILKNPFPFVGNLVRAAKLGFQRFAGAFGRHLKAGLIDWLTGSLPGIYIPKAFTLPELVKFVFSALGLSWANVRAKLVKAVGETAVKVMETGFDVVVTLVTQGPAAAWDKIKEALGNLQSMVIGGITDLVIDTVTKKAIPKLVAMFIPGAGFISAILSIYDTVMVFVSKISKIIQVVTGFINSITAIAAGQVEAAAKRVEGVLAGLLSLAINFLAGFAGLGRVSDKIMGVLGKVRTPIDKALDALVGWVVGMAKKLGGMISKGAKNLFGQLFRKRAFAAGAEAHSAWVSEQGEPMVASQVMPLAARITEWRGRVRDLDKDTQPRARGLLDQAHALRVDIGKKSREVIAAQRKQDEAVIQKRQPEIEAHYGTLVGILQQLFVIFGDVKTERGAAMDAGIARVFNAYDQQVLPLKRGRPPLVTGSPVTIYSQLQALWNQDAGWAYQMAHGIVFQLERVLESATRVGTSQYPQLTGVEVRIPPYQRGKRTVSGTRVDYTVKDRAVVANVHVMVDVGVEVKKYGDSWDAAKVAREIGKIRRQVRAQIQSNQPRFDAIRLEIGGYARTSANFQAALANLIAALQAEAAPRNITLEMRPL